MTLSWHPAAEVFPMLPEDDLRALAEDIAANGLQHPIEVLPDGTGVDGRNRYAACRLAGIEPTFVTIKPEDVGRYIVSANVHRRNMTTGQRAMATAVVLKMNGHRQTNGRWVKGSVPIGNDNSTVTGWPQAVQRAGLVLDHRPELAAEVITGERALDSAVSAARERATAKKRLDADLLTLVETGVRSADDAAVEQEARNTVREIDKRVIGDGERSYAERVAEGAMTWRDASAAARQWKQDRDETIVRYRRSIETVISHFAYWQNLKQYPWAEEVLAGLTDHDRALLAEIPNGGPNAPRP